MSCHQTERSEYVRTNKWKGSLIRWAANDGGSGVGVKQSGEVLLVKVVLPGLCFLLW